MCPGFSNRVVSGIKIARRLLLTMALEEGVTTGGMIKLESFGYSLWKSMMEDILHCEDLYEPTMKQNGEC